MRGAMRLAAATLPLVAWAVVPMVRAEAGSRRVEVQDFGFLSDEIQVFAEDEVVWTNTGADHHTVTADDKAGEDFDSGELVPGGSFARVFTNTGAFAYHCEVHRSMRGAINVSTKPAPTTMPERATTPTTPRTPDLPVVLGAQTNRPHRSAAYATPGSGTSGLPELASGGSLGLAPLSPSTATLSTSSRVSPTSTMAADRSPEKPAHRMAPEEVSSFPQAYHRGGDRQMALAGTALMGAGALICLRRFRLARRKRFPNRKRNGRAPTPSMMVGVEDDRHLPIKP